MQKRGFVEIATAFGCGCLIIFVGLAAITALGIFASNNKGEYSLPAVDVEEGKSDYTEEEWIALFKEAEGIIAVDWELLAAVMWKETGIGNNFGGCSYYPEAPSGGWVLAERNGERGGGYHDKESFKIIMESLGYPLNKPVSCNPTGSKGGAMGYMQVMPMEWKSNSDILINNGYAPGYLNPWKVDDSLLMGGYILKRKIGISDPATPFPISEANIKNAAAGYYGDPTNDYKDTVYAKYLEIKRTGRL